VPATITMEQTQSLLGDLHVIPGVHVVPGAQQNRRRPVPQFVQPDGRESGGGLADEVVGDLPRLQRLPGGRW
jgi:hypothetical protein